ncbi:MAG: Holliday junction DNA helicase RuvA [Bacteroidetes bacterium GWF2_38_335]|nr:MAG: Holliday junction DNA helicase RuvA [Bacteroidetes bacterium GWF2_38_335]OFY78296.1 MAG: Holliday junction DNA helicase RuvA [Bacteroidetes bacterium RIFOXYA12_FULL_38_20]HBS87509.1 Holliday junction resolvase RuvX [Bacteroidales bacterium]
MGRILAIDYGRKRTGLAVTDPLCIIAGPLADIPSNEVFDYIDSYLKNEKVDVFVVGYPKQMNNEASEAVIYINPFIKKLAEKYDKIQIDLMDERFTSKMAFQAMIDGGLKKKKRQDKGLIDKISAVIILQSWLSMNKK